MTKTRDPRLPKPAPLVWVPFNDLETGFTMTSAFEARDPDPSKDYGIGAVRMSFYVRGPLGCIVWDLSTGWYLPDVAKRIGPQEPSPGAIEFHGAQPSYEGQESREDCLLVPGGHCFWDVGYIIGEEPYEALVREGDQGLYRVLGEWYFRLAPKASDVHEGDKA